MAVLKDGGARREFDGGAVRDISEGKGRCDLLPLNIFPRTTYAQQDDMKIFGCFDKFRTTGSDEGLYQAFQTFCNIRGWLFPTALLEVSIQYEDGARKYSDRNWENGIPIHCFIDSAIRHYLKWLRGDDDEPHDRAVIWNILGAIWTFQNKPEFDDFTIKETVKIYGDNEVVAEVLVQGKTYSV